MPLIRRMPKRGFNNANFKTVYIPINLNSLNQFDQGAKVDRVAAEQAGLANGKADGIKILGNGTLTKKLTVVANAFSAAARKKIEELGGTCEICSAAVPKAK